MFLLDIGSPISGGAKKRAENHMTLSSFLSGLLDSNQHNHGDTKRYLSRYRNSNKARNDL